jgi:hypothetical protein
MAAMNCPSCRATMYQQTLEGNLGRPVSIDICRACQAFWFDAHESLQLTPASTLALFKEIGTHAGPGRAIAAEAVRCPRCTARLHVSHDMQRHTRFEYLSCPERHGRFTTFFNFLREKDFIRPLTSEQIAELRRHMSTVNCSNCGAAVDLAVGTVCSHCGSPLSMLDLEQASALIEQLQRAADRTRRPVDPALPLALARARRDSEIASDPSSRNSAWLSDVASSGLVGAGLATVARWINELT